MLRGTVVMVNNKAKLPHLRGTTGIALERTKDGYIKVLSRYQGWLTDLCYPEDELIVLEPPEEL